MMADLEQEPLEEEPGASSDAGEGSKPKQRTTYVLFEKVILEAKDAWTQVAEFEAASAEQAIRYHAGTANKSGVFVAVPASSFKPRTVVIDTVTTVNVT